MPDTSAKPKSREELEKEWWDRWWAEDYSWEGLIKKRIDGAGGLHGEKTLQDYWRRDPATGQPRDLADLKRSGELIFGPNKKLWHAAHVPLTWKDGIAAKSAWDDSARAKLRDLITARLMAGVETKENEIELIECPDGRAQLAGAVLGESCVILPTRESLNTIQLNCPNAWLTDWNANDRTFGLSARFDRATFSGDAWFDSAIFLDCAWFDSATFLDYVGFDSATFLDYVGFDSATFLGDAGFYRATFTGTSVFDNANFSGDARFNSSTFSGYAMFNSATISGNASFDNATFSGITEFNGSRFSRGALFSDVTFGKRVQFDRTVFSGAAGFDSATFAGTASFGFATFSSFAKFDRTDFTCEANWSGAVFKNSIGFQESTFSAFTYFLGAEFCGTMQFETSVSKGLTSFAHCKWPMAARDWHSAFKGMLFDGRAVFAGSGCRAFAAFDGAMFERPISFDVVDEATATATFQDELQGAMAAARIDADQWEAEENGSRRMFKVALVSVAEKALKLTAFRNIRLGELERGCRTLKQAMADATDKSREHMFYRFELMARSAQSTTPWQERFASRVYEVVSDYGTSITRPLMWLAFVWACAALVYVLIGVVVATDKIVVWQWSWDAFDMSLSRVFQPLTFWSAANLQDNALGLELVGQKDRGLIAFGVRLLGAVQSLISIILLFLSALALRRRFQIN